MLTHKTPWCFCECDPIKPKCERREKKKKKKRKPKKKYKNSKKKTSALSSGISNLT